MTILEILSAFPSFNDGRIGVIVGIERLYEFTAIDIAFRKGEVPFYKNFLNITPVNTPREIYLSKNKNVLGQTYDLISYEILKEESYIEYSVVRCICANGSGETDREMFITFTEGDGLIVHSIEDEQLSWLKIGNAVRIIELDKNCTNNIVLIDDVFSGYSEDSYPEGESYKIN